MMLWKLGVVATSIHCLFVIASSFAFVQHTHRRLPTLSGGSSSCSEEQEIQEIEEWFSYLNISKSEQERLYSRWPNGDKEIQRLGHDRLHEWINFFLSETVGMNRNELRKMILSRPQLLSYKLSNMQTTTSFFCEELGLSSQEFASLLQAYPSVLMYSVDGRLRPTVNFLRVKVGGGKDNWDSWKRVICSYPRIFSHSLERTLLPKIDFFHNIVGLKRSELTQVVAKFPPTLWLSEENLQPKLDFLAESLDLKESPELLRTIIVTYPQILGLSLENLRLKMSFFLNDDSGGGCVTVGRHRQDAINCGLSKNQLKELVLYQPALVAYSLENRLKPRMRQMQEKDIS